MPEGGVEIEMKQVDAITKKWPVPLLGNDQANWPFHIKR